MLPFADITLDPRGIITWLAVGLVAGWLAGLVTDSPSYGLIGDLIVGAIGAVIGGFVFGMFVSAGSEFWGSILLAFVGACALISVSRFMTRIRAEN